MSLTTQSGAPDLDARDQVPEVLRLGRYIVLSRLGAGAMGVVFRAYDEVLDRRVALKLLRSRQGDDAGRVRLLREAQALAQLSHPNVVQIYDVGERDDQVFVALEFIHGRTLRDWLKEEPRRWQEIVEVFVQAGRGLAAAHAAGLIHRDFKPDNVLIAHDGRVRVADFGLALAAGDDSRARGDSAGSGSGRLMIRVTAAESLIGTPAYMAPEQFLRLPVEARTDQFSFCVTFFEALFGYRPFVGGTVEELSHRVLLGERVVLPKQTAVPQWLRDLVLRGLDSEIECRFPTMDELLAELTRDHTRARYRLAWASGVAGLGAGLVGFQLVSASPCQGAREHLAEVWDATQSALVADRIMATSLAFAEDTRSRVQFELDAYSEAWTATYIGACEAHQRGEQSSTALDLSMQCLQRRRGELQALVEILAEADAQTVTNAVQAVRGLPAVASCGDVGLLLEEQRRFGGPREPENAAKIAALRQRLAQVEALMLAGQYSRGLMLSEATVGEAEALGFLPALAEAQHRRGRLLQETGAMSEAAVMLRRAYLSAVQAGDEELQARVLLVDVYVRGYGLRDFAAADQSFEVAAALIARTSPGSPIEAELINNLAASRTAQLRLSEAEVLGRRALALRREILPADHFDIGISLNNLATYLHGQGRLDEAEVLQREASTVFERSLGAQHPITFISEGNLALVLFDLGEHEEAGAILDRYHTIFASELIREREDSADLFAVSGLLRLVDEPAEALAELEHAYALGERLELATQRWRTRFALAQGLWALAPDQHARALMLARQAAEDAALVGDESRRAEILAWLGGWEGEPWAGRGRY